jgi:hypothetical protein
METFLEFLKITTFGPQELRLCNDVLLVIHDFFIIPPGIIRLKCKLCDCTLLRDVDEKYVLDKAYWTISSGDDFVHTCGECYFASNHLAVSHHF